MSIANVIDTLKVLSLKNNCKIETKLRCDWHRSVEVGGINEHTSLTGLNFGHSWGVASIKVYLTHRCPIGSFREKRITKAPYYCKQCAQCIISLDQGPSFCLPVDTSIVPKMQIALASPTYAKDRNTDFDMGDMVLTQYDGWVHKCSALASYSKLPIEKNHSEWPITKQTLTALPFRCKLCKKKICEEGMTFSKLANMAKILGALGKK